MCTLLLFICIICENPSPDHRHHSHNLLEETPPPSAAPTACRQHVLKVSLPDDWGPILFKAIDIHHADGVQVAWGAAGGGQGVRPTLVKLLHQK